MHVAYIIPKMCFRIARQLILWTSVSHFVFSVGLPAGFRQLKFGLYSLFCSLCSAVWNRRVTTETTLDGSVSDASHRTTRVIAGQHSAGILSQS